MADSNRQCKLPGRSGARLASAGGDKVVRLWEPASGTQTSQLHGMQDMVTDLAFTCDQNHLVAAGTDKTLRMWDLSTARVKHTLTGHSDKVCCPPRARLLLCAMILACRINVWAAPRPTGQHKSGKASRGYVMRGSGKCYQPGLACPGEQRELQPCGGTLGSERECGQDYQDVGPRKGLCRWQHHACFSMPQVSQLAAM